MTLSKIYTSINNHLSNKAFLEKGYLPIYTVSATAKIVIIGQAPGRKAQETGIPWKDVSGDNLRAWLGINKETFYDSSYLALIPMDFYYPGKGKNGDLPPRKEFAPLWHKKILELMPQVKLIILVGAYSQKYYLGTAMKANLTETVRSHHDYLPTYFPLVHPSPLNGRWLAKNSWFTEETLPALQRAVRRIKK